MISKAEIQRHHAHVDPGHHGHSRGLLFVGCDVPDGHQFLDVFPIGNYKALEAELITEDVNQDVSIDVAGNAVNFRGVDHHRMSAGFDCRVECRQKIFAQIIFRDPCGSAIATAERKTVAHVMFQAGCDMVLRADICSFQATHESCTHYFCEIWILAECFVEAWPHRLASDIKDR